MQVTLHKAYGVTQLPRWETGYLSRELEDVPGAVLTKAPGTNWSMEPLEGQEFLRLAACRTVDDAADYIRAFGDTGFGAAVRLVAPPASGPPTIPLLVCIAPQSLAALSRYDKWAMHFEYVEDWYRFAGLMRATVDAYRIATDSAYRRTARARWRRLFEGPRRHISRQSDGESPIVGGLLQSGFQVRAVSTRRRRFQLIFPPASAALAASLGVPRTRLRPSPDQIVVDTPGDLLQFVAAVLSPGVGLAARGVVVRDKQLHVETTAMGAEALVALHLEAAEAFAARAKVHDCAWHRCPGAPGRQRLFLFASHRTGERAGETWRWRDQSKDRARRRTGMYCSRPCASAAATEASRKARVGQPRSTADKDRRRARSV